jgi:hypothetical protein
MTVKHSDGQKMSHTEPVFTGVTVSECSEAFCPSDARTGTGVHSRYRLECTVSFVEVVFLDWKQLRKQHSV